MLAGKVAIVTGAGRGIGREIALLMAKKGAAVVVNDLGVAGDGTAPDQSPAAAVAAEITSAGGKAVPNTESVASLEGTTNMVQQARDEFGGLHAVVNNAGILRDRMFHKMDPADWQAVIDVHLGGHFNLCRSAINLFREQEYGRIVNFTSTSGLIGNIGQTNYGAAKLAIAGFTRLLALENQRHDITVNAVSPFAWTRMTSSIPVKDEAGAARVEKLKRMKPGHIAPLTVFLASPEAKGISGQIFGARAGELMVFSVPEPTRTVHQAGGWTAEEVGTIAMPALRNFFTPLRSSAEMFPYDPLD